MNITKRICVLLLSIYAILTSVTAVAVTARTGRMFSDPAFTVGIYEDFCRDDDGFLWIATDNGLIKFDGNNYFYYRHDENNPGTISDNRIIHVFADSRGRVWAATSNGLNLYDAQSDSFQRITLPSINYSGYIADICEQTDGTITFIVGGLGLYIIDETGERPTAVRYLLNRTAELGFNCLTSAPDGRLYVGTNNGKVAIVNRNGNVSEVSVTDAYITDIVIEDNGDILLSSVNDIFRISADDNSVSTICSDNDGCKYIKNFTKSPDGSVYYSTAADGLWKIEPGASEATRYPDVYLPSISLKDTKLGSIHADSDGYLWIGCNYRGLACIPREAIPFSYHPLSSSLPDFCGGLGGFAVWGNKIIVGFANSVAELDSSGRKLSQVDIPSHGAVTSLTTSGDRLYIGVSNDGIWSISLPDGRELRKVLDYPGKYPSLKTCVLPDGDILAGFHGIGLMRYNPSTGSRKWYESDTEGGRLNNPYFTSMELSADSSAVWIGLYGGISYYDIAADELSPLDQAPFVKGATFALEPQSDGSVMAGTSHGLVHYDPHKFLLRKYTTLDGLTDNDVRAVITDRNGGWWIATKRGLNHMSADGKDISVYYGGYGLKENAFSFGRPTADSDIVLGSDLGITMFCPDSIPETGFDAKVRVTSMLLNGERINNLTEINGRKVITSAEPLSIRLPYKDNALTLRLSTLDFRDGANVRYMWRLSGYSNDWVISAPGDNVIYLPHLDPGSYSLSLKAMDNNIYSEESHIFIKISTPWYMGNVAKAIYLLIILSVIVLSAIVMKKKREEKIYDAKIKFFMDVSHDIRSPITLMLTPLESLLREPFSPAVNEKLRVMHRNGQRILSLINQLLDLRKIEKGGMRLLCRKTDLTAFVGELVDMFKPQAADKKITLTFDHSGQPDEKVWIDRDNLDKILVNIISNAIKYTQPGGEITVLLSTANSLKSGGVSSVIRVTDTGIGLDPRNLDKIFTRFYRGRENHTAGTAGVGIGLDLCRRLTELHHGTISGRNRTDGIRGSEFTVTIPVSESAYAPSELQREHDNEEETTGYASIRNDRNIVGNDLTTPDNHNTISRRRNIAHAKRILIVDDDAELRQYIDHHLEELGYRTVTASDGSQAMKIITEESVDLVVCDVKMPVMDGLTFLRLVRNNINLHHIPVIILSSKSDIADRIEGWDRGADGYLSKPFSINELDSLIDSLIDNRLRLKGKYSGVQDTKSSTPEPEIKGYDEALMERIISIINDNIDNPGLNVEMLGQSAGISRVHLHRKLKDLIGMTPSNFIRNTRLKQACILLQKPDVEVTQIAYAVGFTSQTYFSTAFKKFTGFSPSEYRAKYLSGELRSEAGRKESDT